MLSNELEYCLNEAFQRARDDLHEFITVEHLLLAILDTPQVTNSLKACGTDVKRLRNDLNEFIDESTPRLHEEDEDIDQEPQGPQDVRRRSPTHHECRRRESRD